jgi:transcriptional regulator with XRE-family HTH domain
MSDPNTLGSLVRRRRLESGYSLGQLASKVGKTAAEVRAWERGNELPEHGIIERLADTLEIDVADIRERLDVARSAEAEAEAEAVDEDTAADDDEANADGAAAIFIDPDVPVEFPEEASDDLEEEPGFAIEDPFTPPEPEEEAEEQPEPEPLLAEPETPVEPEFDLLDAPTEPVPVPVITETATAARAERAVAVLEDKPLLEPAPDADPGLLRYLEPLRILFDPDNRYLYWIRAGLTVIVLLIFAAILFRQLGSLLDAVGELLDTIEPAATNPDDLDALGLITRSGL